MKVCIESVISNFDSWWVARRNKDTIHIDSGQNNVRPDSELYSPPPEGAIELWQWENYLLDVPPEVKYIVPHREGLPIIKIEGEEALLFDEKGYKGRELTE